MPRKKGSKDIVPRKRRIYTQEQKDRVAEGVRKYHAKQKEERENPKLKKKQTPQVHDTLGFRMKDTRENLIVFPIKGIVPNVIFDFERRCVRIEIPGVFSLTLGNQAQEVMKDLARVLNRDYNPEKRHRLESTRKWKSAPRERKRILNKILNDIARSKNEQSG